MGTVTLIAGPPCSGKTTLAQAMAQPGDLILDFDQIAVRLGSPRSWNHAPEFIAAVEQRIAFELRDRGERTTWLIRAAPRSHTRTSLADALGARVWLLDPGLDECLRRARRRPNLHKTAVEIRKWYRMFTPSPVDVRLSPTATTSPEVPT